MKKYFEKHLNIVFFHDSFVLDNIQTLNIRSGTFRRYKLEFKSLMRLFAFHIALISLEKAWIQLWVNSWADWDL